MAKLLVSPQRLSRRRLAVVAGTTAIVGITLVVAILAAGLAASFEPENGTLAGNVQKITATGASGGKAVQFGVAAAPPATPTPPPPVIGGSLNLPLVPWEGGPAYYANFSKAAAWNNPSFFPIGVWFESVLSQSDVDLDKAAGLNTYIELTSNSNAALVRSNGLYSVTSSQLSGYGSEATGWLITDEADMNYGAGSDAWDQHYNDTVSTWDSCIPTQDNGGKCGYTAMATMKSQRPQNDGRMYYANYGKGVMMWENDTEAAKFVNSYTNFVSDDLYFYTDPNLCGGESQTWLGIPTSQCRLSANYGVVIDRLRALDAADGQRQPIFGFVEDGHPFSESTAPTITGPQLAGAVINSLIHEARGIIYFNHNFGGPCLSQHVLRDCGASTIRPAVTAVNSQIKDLAPVLNTQSYQYSFNGSLDTMLKNSSGSYYIFAMQKRPNTSGSYTFTLPAGLTSATSAATVLYENRTVPISGGKFTDSFAAEYSYHIYKITP